MQEVLTCWMNDSISLHFYRYNPTAHNHTSPANPSFGGLFKHKSSHVIPLLNVLRIKPQLLKQGRRDPAPPPPLTLCPSPIGLLLTAPPPQL